MKKKVVLVLAIYLVLSTMSLISCNTDDCGGPFNNRYKTTGFEWSHYRVTNSEDAISGLDLQTIVNDSVVYNQYAISIFFNQEYYRAQNVNVEKIGGMNRVYACSPAEPITDEKLEDILITSEIDFNAEHPAGTNLSDLFDVVVTAYGYSDYDRKYSIGEYLASKPPVPIKLTLILKEAPQTIGEFAFFVQLYLEGIDFAYFGFTTSEIVIRTE